MSPAEAKLGRLREFACPTSPLESAILGGWKGGGLSGLLMGAAKTVSLDCPPLISAYIVVIVELQVVSFRDSSASGDRYL